MSRLKANDEIKIGAILSYVQMALGIIISLIYTPIMIRCLGQSEYGLYSTVSSTISMLSILSLGFNSSYIKFYARYKSNNDSNSIAGLNAVFMGVFVFLGSVALFCGIFISYHLDFVFSTGLTVNEYSIARILTLVLTLNLFLSFPFSVFTSIITAHEKFVAQKLIAMLHTVVSPLLTLPLLLNGYRSIAVVIVSTVVFLITGIVSAYYVIVRLKEKFIFRYAEKGLMKELAIFTSFIALNLIVNEINWSLDKVIIGRFKGTIAVAVYAVGSTLDGYYRSFSTAVSNVFIPRVHSIINSTADDSFLQRRQLTAIFIKVGRIQFLIMNLVLSGIIIFGRAFISLWAGKGYEESYIILLLLCVPETVALIQNLGIEIQRALNRHRFRSVAYIIMALINVVITIFLCQSMGAIGAAIGTAISLIVANGIIMNVYYHKRCNINIVEFWKNIIPMFCGIIPVGVVGYFIFNHVIISNYLQLFINIMIFTITYGISVWYISMNQYEKELILSIRNKVLSWAIKR